MRDASVYFLAPKEIVRAVAGVTARFEEGKITGLIGESGCGKSVLGQAILGMLPPYAKVQGEVCFEGINTFRASAKKMRAIRREKIGVIPQNPAESLNPVRRVGSQFREALALVEKDAKRRQARAEELLEAMGFEDTARIMRAYPFELSGGMQQRVLCAIGVCCSPAWVLADEPTKGLDAELCGQVTKSLLGLRQLGVRSMFVITHDFLLAGRLCEEIAVMYGGEILEKGPDILKAPLHPYTQALLRSMPQNGMHRIEGTPPYPGSMLFGCTFFPRCPKRMRICEEQRPPICVAGNATVRCCLYA